MKRETITGPKVCGRCGYRYVPGGRRVIQFVTAGKDYIACERCITKLGMLIEGGADQNEKDTFIESFAEEVKH